MAQAEIGALRVTLAMDAGEFTRGLSKSEAMLARFGAKAQAAGAAAARALGVLSVAGAAALGALSVAMKKTIDDADRMAKLSQSVGVPVEQLSQLRLAADLSGTSMEQLANGIGRLSRNMADLAAGSGEEARRAFEALGVAVQTSDGTLRSSSAVIDDIADRFARMEDGATKTAFAMQIFGRAGKDMVPLLNSGSAGIRAMQAEAAALGLTIDTNTARAAEAFNDNLTRLGAVAQGFVTQVTARMLPVLERASEYLIGAARSTELLTTATDGLVGVLRFVSQEGARAVLSFARIKAEAEALWQALNLPVTEWRESWRLITEAGAETERQFAQLNATLTDIFTGTASGGAEFAENFRDKIAAPVIQSTKEMTAAERERQAAMREGQALFEQTRTPLEALSLEQARYSDLLAKGAIDAQTWARANSQAVAIAGNAYLGLAGQAAGALAQLFGESKDFAIAQAVINTAQAVTQTLAQYGATPWGLAAAAVAAAAGAVQIATIRSASKGGGGGGVSATPSAAPAPAQASGSGVASVTNIGLQGEFFSRDQVARLIDSINEAVGDGHVLKAA